MSLSYRITHTGCVLKDGDNTIVIKDTDDL